MNVLLDRSAEGRARDLAELKRQVGECDSSVPIVPNGALTGEFTWSCRHGRLHGALELAPTEPPTIQSLQLEAVRDPLR